MKILVVDDSGTMRRIIIRTLTDMGYSDFIEAENGQVALNAVEKGGIELIITDWNMPIMSGLEFVTQARVIEPDLPILMVTTNASNQDVIQALKAGVNNYVINPFTLDTMREKVSAILS